MMPALRIASVVTCLVLAGACTSVRVHTIPEGASIEANGEDISETGEIKNGVGFKDHEVTVRAEGYRSKTVTVERNRTNPIIKWAAIAGSIGCASLSACAACGVGALLGNSVALPTLAGGCLASLGSGDPISSMGAAIVAATATQDALTVPCMGLCTLAGSWPLLGMLIPLLFPSSAEEVTIELERSGDSGTDVQPH